LVTVVFSIERNKKAKAIPEENWLRRN
jgi:hypothetical protein